MHVCSGCAGHAEKKPQTLLQKCRPYDRQSRYHTTVIDRFFRLRVHPLDPSARLSEAWRWGRDDLEAADAYVTAAEARAPLRMPKAKLVVPIPPREDMVPRLPSEDVIRATASEEGLQWAWGLRRRISVASCAEPARVSMQHMESLSQARLEA